MSQFFSSGDQSIGASASVFAMNIQDWFLLGMTGLISLQSKQLSRVFSNTRVQTHPFVGPQYQPLNEMFTDIYDYFQAQREIS